MSIEESQPQQLDILKQLKVKDFACFVEYVTKIDQVLNFYNMGVLKMIRTR